MIAEVTPSRPPNPRADLRQFFETEFAPVMLASDGGQFRKKYVNAIGRFEKFLGHRAKLSDLTAQNLTGFRLWCRKLNREGPSQRVLRIWRFAFEIKRVRKPAACKPSRLLTGVMNDYSACHDLAKDSLKVPRAAIRNFSFFLQVPARLSHLTPEYVNEWLASEVERVSKRTAKNHRAAILTLWRWAFEQRRISVQPERVRMVRAPLPPVAAYTKEEVQQLLLACNTLDDKFCRRGRVPRKLLYRALLLTAWDTGLRSGDLMRIRWSNITPEGCVQLTQHKTGRPVTRWLNAGTVEALGRIKVKGVEHVFRAHTSPETLLFVFRQIKIAAKISRGTVKWIRRAAATQMAIAYGEEAAGRARGHSSVETARKHYIDASQLTTGRLRMPALDLPS